MYCEAVASSSKNRFQLLCTLEDTEEPMNLDGRTEEPKSLKREENWPALRSKKRKNDIKSSMPSIDT